jgi:hypothetical protein
MERLQRVRAGDNNPITVSGYADAIGRCYQLLGDEQSAKEFFTLCANEHLRSMDIYYENFGGVSLGNKLMECGLALWRIHDERSHTFFMDSLKAFGEMKDSSSGVSRMRFLIESAYPSLFLGDYQQAKNNIRTAIEERLRYDVLNLGESIEELLPYASGFLSIHLRVIRAFEEDTKDGYEEIILKLKDYYIRNEIEMGSWHPPITLRLYDLVVRRKEEKQKEE